MTDPASDPDLGRHAEADEAESAIRFRSDMTVELVKATAHDSDVVFAARVSTAGEQSLADVDTDGDSQQGPDRFPDARTPRLLRRGHRGLDRVWLEVVAGRDRRRRVRHALAAGEIELQRAERRGQLRGRWSHGRSPDGPARPAGHP